MKNVTNGEGFIGIVGCIFDEMPGKGYLWHWFLVQEYDTLLEIINFFVFSLSVSFYLQPDVFHVTPKFSRIFIVTILAVIRLGSCNLVGLQVSHTFVGNPVILAFCSPSFS